MTFWDAPMNQRTILQLRVMVSDLVSVLNGCIQFGIFCYSIAIVVEEKDKVNI